MKTSITWEEWISEVTKGEDRTGWMTYREIIGLTGFSEKRIRSLLRDGVEAGDIEVAMLTRPNVTGAIVSVPGYRIKKVKK